MIIILFTWGLGVYALSKSKYEYVEFLDTKNNDEVADLPDNTSAIILFASAYNHLMGILGGGFYLHNISLPIYRNSKKPENNVRDMFIGFLCVCLSYCSCGVLGYYGFSSQYIFPDLKGAIS